MPISTTDQLNSFVLTLETITLTSTENSTPATFYLNSYGIISSSLSCETSNLIPTSTTAQSSSFVLTTETISATSTENSTPATFYFNSTSIISSSTSCETSIPMPTSTTEQSSSFLSTSEIISLTST